MEKWTPAMSNGRLVRSKFHVTIMFPNIPYPEPNYQSDSLVTTLGLVRCDVDSTSSKKEMGSKSDSNYDDDDDMIMGMIVEQKPVFPGGQKALMEFLKSNLVYPKAARDSSIQGRVMVKFTVEKDGSSEEVNVNKAAYMWNGTQWVALNGNVEANKVILTSDITMAGNYTQVGNLTKTQTGTATFATKGMSVASALTEIFSKRLQPSISANPSLNDVTISVSGAKEAGTVVESVTVSAVTFNAGSYSYGPATGVTVSSWKTERISNNGTVELSDVGAGGAVTDSGSFKIGDQTGDYSSIKYKVTATYGDGVLADDNLGDPCTNNTKITGSTTSKESGSITSFRKYFYGALTSVPATVDSDFIRGLTNSTGAWSNGKKVDITIPEGAKIVVIAYPATFNDLSMICDKAAFGTDILGSSFVKSTVAVEGANDYTAINYKVYVYTPDAALGANEYNVNYKKA
jgi:hypothetical protein